MLPWRKGIHSLSSLTSFEMAIEGKGSSHHIPVTQGINAGLSGHETLIAWVKWKDKFVRCYNTLWIMG